MKTPKKNINKTENTILSELSYSENDLSAVNTSNSIRSLQGVVLYVKVEQI